MKKILTAMTAMTMTLQANENLEQKLSPLDSKINNSDTDLETFKNNLNSQYYNDNLIRSMAKSNADLLGASGSFLTFEKTVRLGLDTDSSGGVTVGDVLIYDIFTENNGDVNASGLFMEDILDANTSLITGSVNTTQGLVVMGNNDGDTDVTVGLDFLDQYESSLVSFAAVVESVPDGQIIEISNQALLTIDNLGLFVSDDPNIFEQPADPTVITAYGTTSNLYIENIDGDFVEHYENPTQLILQTELDRVSGEVGGAGIDLEDCFQFTVEPSRIVHSIELENYRPSGDNHDTAYHVYHDLPPIKFQYGDFYNGLLSEYNIGNGLIGGNTMFPGTYSFCMVEGTPGQKYSLIIQSEIEDNIFNNSFE